MLVSVVDQGPAVKEEALFGILQVDLTDWKGAERGRRDRGVPIGSDSRENTAVARIIRVPCMHLPGHGRYVLVIYSQGNDMPFSPASL